MDTKRIVFAKLAAINAAKTSLSHKQKGRKVNLALVEDMAEALEVAMDRVREIMDETEEAGRTIRELLADLPDGQTFSRDLSDLASQLEVFLELATDAANEIGLDPDVIPGYDKVDIFINKDIQIARDFVDSYNTRVNALLSAGF